MENNTPNTNNFLNWVEIKNFKSIKDLRLDCKRVNVFIGKPNVGKSNILEGLGLLGAGYGAGRFFKKSMRYKEIRHLFYDNDARNVITIVSDRIEAQLLRDQEEKKSGDTYGYSQNGIHTETEGGQLISGPVLAHIVASDGILLSTTEFTNPLDLLKKYDFANLTEFENLFQDYLLPPNGPNLYEVVRRNKDLWAELAKLFTEQQLELVLYDEKQEFILQKKDSPYVWQYPFFSIADTFRRFMFYITAIESNKNSVLVFEEPEVHSFPPYVQNLAFRMIESETNQFFVSTHSPYLLQTLIEHLGDDQLNVFITYYENYQTKVRALTPDELSEVQKFSIDIFYNLRRFLPHVNA